MTTELTINEELLKGEINPLRDYFITLGQSEGSKGVMFVLYSVAKETTPYCNPMTYLGILADDIETAVINARKRVPKFQLEIDIDETFAKRRKPLTMPFGKYKGETLDSIFEKDEKYIYWLYNSNTVNFKNPSILEKLADYGAIAKENIITVNKGKSNEALALDTESIERKFTVYKANCEESGFGYNNVIYKFRMKDEYGNLFTYQGTSRIFVDKFHDFVEGKNLDVVVSCKVVGQFESMGLVFNKIKLR